MKIKKTEQSNLMGYFEKKNKSNFMNTKKTEQSNVMETEICIEKLNNQSTGGQKENNLRFICEPGPAPICRLRYCM